MIMRTKFVYVGIRVKGLQRSIDFYSKLLGMKVVDHNMFEQTGGKIVNLTSDDGGLHP